MQSINRAERRRSRRELAKRPQWGTLEEFARSRIQSWLQDVLEEEVTELLGRGKSERRAVVDAPAGYRNGHGKTRRLSMMAGTIEVKRPRVRGLEQRFESRLLPLFVRRTEAVNELFTPALPARTCPRRFRTGVARTARRRRSAFGLVDRAAAGEVATGVRGMAKPAAGQSRSGLRLGRWSLCESGS